jgi:hypothetical protein
MARKKIFKLEKEVRKLARERVGKVPAGHLIQPKGERPKPKHKKPIAEDEEV